MSFRIYDSNGKYQDVSHSLYSVNSQGLYRDYPTYIQTNVSSHIDLSLSGEQSSQKLCFWITRWEWVGTNLIWKKMSDLE